MVSAPQLRSVFANAAAGRFLAVASDDLVGCPATQVIRHAVTGMEDADAV